jgi:hypothetical protein
MEGYPTAAKDLVLLALALYGAVLSTFNWRYQVRRDAAQIRVVAGMMTPADGSRREPTYAKVEAINVGRCTVMIDILTLELPSARGCSRRICRAWTVSRARDCRQACAMARPRNTLCPVTRLAGRSARTVLSGGQS